MTTATIDTAFVTMIEGMIAARRTAAATHGITTTDNDIADDIKASLLRMATATPTRHIIGSLGTDGTDHIATCTCGWTTTHPTTVGANNAADAHLKAAK